MRKAHLDLIQKMNTEAAWRIASDHGDLGQSMDFWVIHYGASAAAWLLFTHRKQLHRAGAIDFHMPKNIPTPPWMRVALETIKRRKERWEVRHVAPLSSSDKVFRVIWHAWRHYQQPSAMRQSS